MVKDLRSCPRTTVSYVTQPVRYVQTTYVNYVNEPVVTPTDLVNVCYDKFHMQGGQKKSIERVDLGINGSGYLVCPLAPTPGSECEFYRNISFHNNGKVTGRKRV